jgi:hypothetical protein
MLARAFVGQPVDSPVDVLNIHIRVEEVIDIV